MRLAFCGAAIRTCSKPPCCCRRISTTWELAKVSWSVLKADTELLWLPVLSAISAIMARYSIGRRDGELLALRERLFGSRLTGAAQCPACGQAVELDFAVNDIRTEPVSETDRVHDLKWADYELCFRLPSSADLAALEPHLEKLAAKTAIVQRCVTAVKLKGEATASGPLPVAVIDVVSERMAELDPQGDVQLALNCPGCSHRWESSLDIASYLWAEIQTWAGRMLRDVHALASAYGWRETDILSLSPWRRQVYLEMIQP